MFELARLQRKIERLNQSAQIKAQEMHDAQRPMEEIQREALKTWMEVRAAQDEIQKFKTDQLVRVANHLGLPTPSYTDAASWEHDTTDKYTPHHLTPAAQTQLRQAIRQEKKERREMVTSIINDIISPIGGIIISILSLLVAYLALKLKVH